MLSNSWSTFLEVCMTDASLSIPWKDWSLGSFLKKFWIVSLCLCNIWGFAFLPPELNKNIDQSNILPHVMKFLSMTSCTELKSGVLRASNKCFRVVFPCMTASKKSNDKWIYMMFSLKPSSYHLFKVVEEFFTEQGPFQWGGLWQTIVCQES